MRATTILAAVLAALCSGGWGAAQVVPDPDVLPDWIRRPAPGDLNAVWPSEAMKKGIGGQAVIHCKLTAQGALYDCKVVEESPAGMGFGVAAVALTPQMAFRPAMKDGKPVAYDGVRIPINFKAPSAPPSRTHAPNELPAGRVATGVRWSDGPSYADVVAAYPEKARTGKVGGHAALECYFNKEGGVRNCRTMTEAPKGYGFAAAAKSLTGKFQGPPKWSDGKSTAGARVDLKFSFAPEMLDPTIRPITGKPDWLQLPTSDQLAASLPEAARDAGHAQARAMLACRVMARGQVGDCKPISETPAGYGVGAAATALSEHFILASWSVEGLPTIGAEVKIPLRFDFGPAEPAKAAAKP